MPYAELAWHGQEKYYDTLGMRESIETCCESTNSQRLSFYRYQIKKSIIQIQSIPTKVKIEE